jgi:hypothetical protein
MALLQEVLANLCQKAGLTPSQVDLSLVTGTIEGFVVSNRASEGCPERGFYGNDEIL